MWRGPISWFCHRNTRLKIYLSLTLTLCPHLYMLPRLLTSQTLNCLPMAEAESLHRACTAHYFETMFPPKSPQANPLETPLELGDPNCPSSRMLQITFPSHNTRHAQLEKPSTVHWSPPSTTHGCLSVPLSTKYTLRLCNLCAQHDTVAKLKKCHIVTCVCVCPCNPYNIAVYTCHPCTSFQGQTWCNKRHIHPHHHPPSLTPTRGATQQRVDCESLTPTRGATEQSVDWIIGPVWLVLWILPALKTRAQCNSNNHLTGGSARPRGPGTKCGLDNWPGFLNSTGRLAHHPS